MTFDNPYAAPSLGPSQQGKPAVGVKSTLTLATDQLIRHFPIIATFVMLIWFPIDLICNYMDSYVFGEDEFAKSFRFSQFLHGFIGVIATGGILFVSQVSSDGGEPTLADAMLVSIKSWPKLLLTNFVSNLGIFLCLVLLIVPGVILAIRWSLVNAIVIREGKYGFTATHQSYELTKGHSNTIVGIWTVLALIYLAGIILMIAPSVLFPELENWILQTFLMLPLNFVSAFGLLCYFSLYDLIRAATIDKTNPQPFHATTSSGPSNH